MFSIYLFQFLQELLTAVFWSCWAYGMLEQGTSLNQASLYLGAFFLTIAALEVPTGFIADRFGRKQSTLLGTLLVSVAFGLNGIVGSSPLHYLSFAMAGLGFTLVSGANTAWMMALARKARPSQNFEHFFLNQSLLGRVAMALGAFTGTRLLMVSAVYMWTAAMLAGLATLALGLTFPDEHKSGTDAALRSADLWSRVKGDLSKVLVILFLCETFLFGLENGLRNVISQPYVVNLLNGNLLALAYLQVTLASVRVVGILLYRFLLSRFNRGFGFCVAALIAFAAAEWIASVAGNYATFIIAYSVGVMMLGWYFPVRTNLLNAQVSEESRATMLSIDSMFNNLASGLACIVLSFAPLPVDGLAHIWVYGAVFLGLAAVVLGVGMVAILKR